MPDQPSPGPLYALVPPLRQNEHRVQRWVQAELVTARRRQRATSATRIGPELGDLRPEAETPVNAPAQVGSAVRDAGTVDRVTAAMGGAPR